MSVNMKQSGALVPIASLTKAIIPLGTGDCYSTEERQVGCFVDGKPVYQKTIYISALPSAKGTGIYQAGVSGVEACWVVDATTGASNLNMVRANENDVSSFQSASIYARCASVDGALNVYVDVGRDRSSLSAYVTVRYTKTTDTAGSGIWTPNGEQAHHFSTSEQIIGTWIDGKTLYERTITGLSIQLNGANWVNYNGVTGIDKLINLHAYTVQTSGDLLSCLIAEYVYSASYGIRVSTTATTFNRTINILTIQYTKT